MTSFRMKPSLISTPILEHVSFSDDGSLLETLQFFDISQGSYKPLKSEGACQRFFTVKEVYILHQCTVEGD